MHVQTRTPLVNYAQHIAPFLLGLYPVCLAGFPNSKILFCVLVATISGTLGNPSQPDVQTRSTNLQSTFLTRLAFRRCRQFTSVPPSLAIFIVIGAAGMTPDAKMEENTIHRLVVDHAIIGEDGLEKLTKDERELITSFVSRNQEKSR